jgi:hypothetical protein
MTEHVFYHEHVFGVNFRVAWKSSAMNVQVVTALGYAVLAVVFVFTHESRAFESDVFAWTYIVVAMLIQIVTGFLIPRLWAYALPFVALVVALPIAEPVEPGMRITDAGVMFIGGVVAMILMSLGMAIRLTIDGFRNPPEPPSTRSHARA